MDSIHLPQHHRQQQPHNNHNHHHLTLQNIHTNTDAEPFFDLGIEPDSPGSPVEELDYLQLVAKETNVESGYVCSSPTFSRASSGDSRGSLDGPFFDLDSQEDGQRSLSQSLDYYDCDDIRQILSDQSDLRNGHSYMLDSDSCSESLPQSQSTTTSLSTFTGNSSASTNTLQDETLLDLCLQSKQQYDDAENEPNHQHFNGSQTHENHDSSMFSTKYLYPKKCDTEEKPYGVPMEQNTQNEVEQSEYVESSKKKQKQNEEEYDERPQRVRRCSSLKTGKTPPGTPGHKKIVRFADVLGLDLADVKTFMDEIPTIPKSAYEDLVITQQLMAEHTSESVGPYVDKMLVPLFQQPGGMPGFLDLVREQNVCLENAIVTDPICLTITGNVRVRNLDFNKSVHLRYTLDAWHSYADFQANYIENSCDGFSDRFTFTVFGNSLQIGQRIEMAVRFSCKGDQYWDNNFGVNYCFQCLAPTTPQPPKVDDTLSMANSSAAIIAENLCLGTFY